MFAYVVKIQGEMQKMVFWSHEDAADFMWGVDGGYEIVKVEIKEISSDKIDPC